jgi:hypothetical protein
VLEAGVSIANLQHDVACAPRLDDDADAGGAAAAVPGLEVGVILEAELSPGTSPLAATELVPTFTLSTADPDDQRGRYSIAAGRKLPEGG